MRSRAKRRKERYKEKQRWRCEGNNSAGCLQKIRNFPPFRVSPVAAAVLFILSTVHLTLECADDSPLFSAHFALALLLRAFSLPRLFGNLLFFSPRSRDKLLCFLSRKLLLIIVILSRRPFSFVIHNRTLMLVLKPTWACSNSHPARIPKCHVILVYSVNNKDGSTWVVFGWESEYSPLDDL